MTKIAVFVSGRGSNFKALSSKLSTSGVDAEIALLAANKECPAAEFARSLGIETCLVSNAPGNGFLSYEELLTKMLEKKIGLVVLAGFMKKLPDKIVEAFSGKIINIHPALLPSFGGKGMYGMNVHRAVFESSAKFSGATVHFVDKIYDHGKIIDQSIVDIHNVVSPEEIADAVLKKEHELLPKVVVNFVNGKIKIINGRIIVED